MAHNSRVISIIVGRKPRYGNDDSKPWENHIIGCIGEYCVAKHLGLFWNGSLGHLHAKDVGDVQVRATSYYQGELMIHDEDLDNDVFVFVRGKGLVWTIHGWAWGRDVKQDKFWNIKIKRHAYTVGPEILRDMAILEKRIIVNRLAALEEREG